MLWPLSPILQANAWCYLHVCLGNPKNRNRRSCYFNGGEKKGPGKAGEEWGLENLGNPWDEGNNTRRRRSGQSPCPSLCDPIITARTSGRTTCTHPLSILCPFPSEIPSPTHRHPNLVAPQPAPSRRQALFPCGLGPGAVAIRCYSNHGAPHSLASRMMIGEGKRP